MNKMLNGAYEESKDEAIIEVMVQDTGIGIKEGDIGKLF